MLKAAGLFLLFSACLSFGFGKSHALKKRLEFLRELKKALLLLSGEIRCAKTPLPDAFRKIGGKLREPLRGFFQSVAKELEGKEENCRKSFFRISWAALVKVHGTGKTGRFFWNSENNWGVRIFLFSFRHWSFLKKV